MADDVSFLRLAIKQSLLCQPSKSRWSVGCVITTAPPQVIVSTGYSDELKDCHAEHCAILKLKNKKPTIEGPFWLYSSMEPCSLRKSQKIPCCDHIVNCHIEKVVFGIKEPNLFVDCFGSKQLLEKGIEVLELQELANECMQANQHLK